MNCADHDEENCAACSKDAFLAEEAKEFPESPVDKFLLELDNVGWGSAPVATMREMIEQAARSALSVCESLQNQTQFDRAIIIRELAHMTTEFERLAAEGLVKMGKV